MPHDYFSSFNQSDHCFLGLALSLPKSLISEFKKLRRQLQRRRHIKIELCVKSSLLRLFRVDHVVQNRRTALSLACTNGFHDKAKRFTAASSRCRQNLKCENFTSSFGRLRQSIASTSVPHVQHDCFSLLNQSNQ